MRGANEAGAMTPKIIPQPGIMEIALYQGGESRIAGRDEVLKLSSNENPLGASEAAKAAFRATADHLHRYPSTNHAGLRTAIGEVHGLDPDRIICGAGSDEVFTFITQAYAGPGDEVIHTEHGFSLYPIVARAAGATPVEVPERDRRVDVDAILAGVTERTRIVFLANPGNPSGTMIGEPDLERLADGLPGNVLLVLDGAYAEYADGYDGGAALAGARGNVVMTRTFSKLYGLGGLRVGWGYGPRGIIEVLNRVRAPFNLSASQLATAEAAVRDRDWARAAFTLAAEMRVYLRQGLRDLGIACDESFANFVLARFASRHAAEGAEAFLRDNGILVRKVAGYGFPEGLRITVGTRRDCDRVIASLRAFREQAA